MARPQRPPCIPRGGLLLVAFVFLSVIVPRIRVVQCEDEDLYTQEAEPFFKVIPLDNAIKNVTYDARSLMINGKRETFICGAIHYPRLRPEYWDEMLMMTRKGGCNCLQTYVFWNVHEPEKGQYNFTGDADLVLFIKKAAEHGLYVILRIGPFIQAEWNHGGLPYWIREEKNITIRTDNEAYKKIMQDWTTKIVNMMKENKLYAVQGGPIFLSQIENEYEHVKDAYREAGTNYIKWAGRMAVAQNTGVPWVMCKQKDAPPEVINACNGRRCAETFKGPNMPTKPKIWTENWTAQYRAFGDTPSKRGAEDIAQSVAHWFAKNGTQITYYMYYGGTTFGRNTGAFVTTRYYDEAPIDEYGLLREPKYSHLRDLHYTIELTKNGLWGEVYTYEKLDRDREFCTYEDPVAKTCVGFLMNNNTHHALDFQFKGKTFKVPKKSISILPDCKNAVYNTEMVVSQHSVREFIKSESIHKDLKWEVTTESVPEIGGTFSQLPLEQYHFTKHTTDYMWYMTSIELDASDLPFRKSIQPVLDILSLGDGLLVFVNGKFAGSGHGSKKQPKFVFSTPVQLHEGVNHFAFLQSTMGMPDSGAYMEHRFTGLRSLIIQGLGTGNLDLTRNGWHHKVSLEGERLQYFTEEGAKKAKWSPAKDKSPPLTWYKAKFDAPPGNEPLAIRMDNMTKGMIWVNGFMIGRYWTSLLTVLKEPSQDEYHIPRSLIKPKDNLVVIFDEDGGHVKEIDISVADRNAICSWILEDYPPHVSAWKWEGNELKANDTIPKASLQCPSGNVVKVVQFASFGDPWGICGLFRETPCHAKDSKKIVEKLCLGKRSCEIPVDKKVFLPDKDPCPDVKVKTLAVQLKCGPK